MTVKGLFFMKSRASLQRRIAENISKEQGKTVADAEGSTLRGLQVVESCCSVTHLTTGDTMHSVSKDMDIHSYRVPLGVTAGWVKPRHR